jgi:DNA-binding CsgD family transcriptional regulator
MGKSRTLRVQEVRAIIRLVGECRDLGDDPYTWRHHLIERACALVDAGMGLSGEWRPPAKRGDVPVRLAGTDWGWHNGFEWRWWPILLREHTATGPLANPMVDPWWAEETALPQGSGMCRTRADLVSDAEWYRSPYYQTYHIPIGADSLIQCTFPLKGTGDMLHELSLCRRIGAPDFSLRDRTIVFELNGSIASLVGGPLAGFSEPIPSRLSPRRREVLAALLEGDSDKQIARRLGISGNTVNQHVQAIYSYFGVCSRSELLARWVQRGWGRCFGWTEGLQDR